MSLRVLAGDIGGTNARLALVEVRAPTQARILHQTRMTGRVYAGGIAKIVRRLASGAFIEALRNKGRASATCP